MDREPPVRHLPWRLSAGRHIEVVARPCPVIGYAAVALLQDDVLDRGSSRAWASLGIRETVHQAVQDALLRLPTDGEWNSPDVQRELNALLEYRCPDHLERG